MLKYSGLCKIKLNDTQETEPTIKLAYINSFSMIYPFESIKFKKDNIPLPFKRVEDYYYLDTQTYIKTPQNINCHIMSYDKKSILCHQSIETDWYPKSLRLFFNLQEEQEFIKDEPFCLGILTYKLIYSVEEMLDEEVFRVKNAEKYYEEVENKDATRKWINNGELKNNYYQMCSHRAKSNTLPLEIKSGIL